MTLYVILFFIALLIGMAVSVYAFGTGSKRAKIFKEIYYSIEDVGGMGILYTKTGEYSASVSRTRARSTVPISTPTMSSPISSQLWRRPSAKAMPSTSRMSSSVKASMRMTARSVSSFRMPISVISKDGNTPMATPISPLRRRTGRVS